MMSHSREKFSIPGMIAQLDLPVTSRDEEKTRMRLIEFANTFAKMLKLTEKRDAFTWQKTSYNLQRQEIQLARAGLHDICEMISGRLMSNWRERHPPKQRR